MKSAFKKIILLSSLLSIVMFWTSPLFAAINEEVVAANEETISSVVLKSKTKAGEVSLSEPVWKDDALLSWAVNVAKVLNTFDYYNYKTEFNAASKYFTRKGWSNYQKAFKKSGNLQQVLDNELTVTIKIGENPVILEQGVQPNKIYQWKVEIPAVITYQGAINKAVEPSVINMTIERVDTKKNKTNPEGIAVFEYAIFAAPSQ